MTVENPGQVPTPIEPGQEPEPTPASEPKTYDETYVKQLRQEAAANRTKLSAYERQEEERRQASLSETQKVLERAEAAERALGEAQERNHKRTILSVARDAGAVDPDVVLTLLDRTDLDMADDAAVKSAIEALLDSKPYLKTVVADAKLVAPKITPVSPPRNQQPSWAGRGNRL